jgi:hypothetical protein
VRVIGLELAGGIGFHRLNRTEEMARKTNPNTWRSYKESGKLQERHVLMSIDLGMTQGAILEQYATAVDRGNLLLLEWVEDRFFAKHGHYSPDSEATPENQAEHPAENSLLMDPSDAISRMCYERGSREDDEDAFELAGELIERLERETPVSYGEIHEEDRRMLRRQLDFRNAARAVTGLLAAMPEVQQVRVFGSVALPLWKEVSRHRRLRQKDISVFHECGNIDLAVWVNSPAPAEQMRKACSQVVRDLDDQEIYLGIAHHLFSIHLIQAPENRYLGMVCHFNKCPKHKPECQVPGCGANRFVQILPWFRLKPERLNEFNSQILFQREG